MAVGQKTNVLIFTKRIEPPETFEKHNNSENPLRNFKKACKLCSHSKFQPSTSNGTLFKAAEYSTW